MLKTITPGQFSTSFMQMSEDTVFHCTSVLLCFLTESCKDILAASGNYAQPEVTTLTWCWLATKRRKSMNSWRRTCCTELQLLSPLSLPEWTADLILCVQDKIFFLSLSYIHNHVVQNMMHSRFTIFTLIYAFKHFACYAWSSIVWCTVPLICLLFSEHVNLS